MPVDTAYARLVDANPVPDPATLKSGVEAEALLLDVTEGRHAMQTEMKPVEAEGGSARSATWLKGVAAAAAIVVAIAIVFVARSGDVASTLSPVEVGEAYFIALGDHDVDAVRDLFAPDIVFEGMLTESADDMIGFIGLNEAINWRYTLGGCVEGPFLTGRFALSTIDETVAVCEYSHQNAWMDNPRTAGWYLFTVDDGRIVHLKSIFISFPEWDEFLTWTTSNHLDDKNIIFLQGDSMPAITPEALVLWEQFTNEYVAERAAGG